jgi:hypothetical protein
LSQRQPPRKEKNESPTKDVSSSKDGLRSTVGGSLLAGPIGDHAHYQKLPSERSMEKALTSTSHNQSENDRGVKVLIAAHRGNIPVAIIVGERYRWWPLQMKRFCNTPVTGAKKGEAAESGKYAVLGWYRVRDVWEELVPLNRSIEHPSETILCSRFRFAFEWVEAQGKPWWIADLETANEAGRVDVCTEAAPFSQVSEVTSTSTCVDVVSSTPRAQDVSGLETGHVCSCNHTTRLIYHEGWFCGNSKCALFGKVCIFAVTAQKNFLTAPVASRWSAFCGTVFELLKELFGSL